jgi:hypothetical protein
MTRIIPLDELKKPPNRAISLRTQGIPEGREVPERILEIVDDAANLYEALCRPQGVLSEISLDEFLDVYEGDGQNAVPAPMPAIASNADRLALFAATIGAQVSQQINELFRANDPALGCMLDGIASERADTAAILMGDAFLGPLSEAGEVDSETRVLPYSPGYCGWHITGQRKLFAYLNPGLIDIELSDTCLMSPLKSVSGVLVAGRAEIHAFDNEFEFCLDCANWECRDRIASLTRR